MVQAQKKRAKRCSSSSRKIEGQGAPAVGKKAWNNDTPEMVIQKMTGNRFGPRKVTDSLMLQQKCGIR